VTGELIAHHFINKTEYKDYAILYRGNHQSRVFEKFLMQNRIPYRISGAHPFSHAPRSRICWLTYAYSLIRMMTAHSCVS
jgi:superfamily I DNA/RNA helicase